MISPCRGSREVQNVRRHTEGAVASGNFVDEAHMALRRPELWLHAGLTFTVPWDPGP